MLALFLRKFVPWQHISFAVLRQIKKKVSLISGNKFFLWRNWREYLKIGKWKKWNSVFFLKDMHCGWVFVVTYRVANFLPKLINWQPLMIFCHQRSICSSTILPFKLTASSVEYLLRKVSISVEVFRPRKQKQMCVLWSPRWPTCPHHVTWCFYTASRVVTYTVIICVICLSGAELGGQDGDHDAR